MLSHYGRQKSGRQTHAKQNIFKICKLFKRLIDVIFDNVFTLHFINTFVKSRAWEKPFFSQLGHLSSAQRNAKHYGQLKKVILNCDVFSLGVLNTFTFWVALHLPITVCG